MRSLKERTSLLELREEQMRLAYEMHPEPALRAKLDYLVTRLRRHQWHVKRLGLGDDLPAQGDAGPQAA